MTDLLKKITVNIVSESDISIQGHGVHTAYDEMATALEKRSDIKVIRGKFGSRVTCDILHIHTIGLHALYKIIFHGTAKIVITAHVVPNSLVGSLTLAKYWLFAAKWYMRWFYSRADVVLAVSGTVAQTLKDELHVHADKIITSYNAIDMSRYAPTPTSRADAREKLGINKNQFIVFGNGQMQPRKRVDIFQKMASELPDVMFIWAGGIPFKQLGADYRLMKRVSQNPPKNLLFTGIIPHEKMVDYLHAADVFCLPAEQENHPMCILEAAGAELPIIARDIADYDDTFGDDVLRCNDETFSVAVKKLQNSVTDYALWKRKSADIASRFDSAKSAELNVAIYRKLLAKESATKLQEITIEKIV